ncbi:hypothetical protein BKA62DRAFT_608260, partial [Auriculariales sp. MPI-PUGE-AT-0066]
IVACVVLTGTNRSELVPEVWKHATVGLDEADKTHLTRRLRDAIFKGGVLTGYSRAINSLMELNGTLPENLRASNFGSERGLDWPKGSNAAPTLDEVAEHGRKYFFELYGDTAVPVQNTLDSIHPDMGFFSSTLAYGLVYGGAWHLLNMPETSFVLVAALIAVDTPRQVGWHLANTRRLGVPLAQARAVREMAIQVARAAGVTWRESVPEVPD